MTLGDELRLCAAAIDRGDLEAQRFLEAVASMAGAGVGSGAEDLVARVGLDETITDLGPALPAGLLGGGPAAVSGRTIGRYRDPEPLGEGGMGIVYTAYDPELRRTVAVKKMRAASFDVARLAKFLREARITGHLQHPNIVPVHELGLTEDGDPFFSMKRVEGATLGEVLALPEGERPPDRRLLALFLKVCDAVAYAHARGIIHRDLKPANIMVGAFGEVLVMDWGLGRRIAGDPEDADPLGPTTGVDAARTADGQVVGTPAYMSPEQAEGDLERVDERSDLYSLGAILYELLCGERPHTGDSGLEILARVAEGRIEPPSTRSPERRIPAALDAIATRALARDPADRYASVEEFQRDIEYHLDGYSPTAQGGSPLRRFGRWYRHRRVPACFRLVDVDMLCWASFFVGISVGTFADPSLRYPFLFLGLVLAVSPIVRWIRDPST